MWQIFPLHPLTSRVRDAWLKFLIIVSSSGHYKYALCIIWFTSCIWIMHTVVLFTWILGHIGYDFRAGEFNCSFISTLNNTLETAIGICKLNIDARLSVLLLACVVHMSMAYQNSIKFKPLCSDSEFIVQFKVTQCNRIGPVIVKSAIQ